MILLLASQTPFAFDIIDMDSTDVLVGALDVWDVWVGKTFWLPPLLPFSGTHTETIQHLLTRRTQVKGMTKSMFLHLLWIPSRRSPHFGDKEMTEWLRQTLVFAVDFLQCLTYLLGWFSATWSWNGRLLPSYNYLCNWQTETNQNIFEEEAKTENKPIAADRIVGQKVQT